MKTLSYDEWLGNRDFGKSFEINIEEMEMIKDVLKRLDGKKHTQILIKGIENSLLIGGGNHGSYVCTFIKGNHEEFYNLLSNGSGNFEYEVEITTGGQAGLFLRKMVNDIDNVWDATYYFILFDQLNPKLLWEKD